MSRGRSFAVWFHGAASERPGFSLQPVGYIPNSVAGVRARALSPPLPLGFADALKSMLERSVLESPGARFFERLHSRGGERLAAALLRRIARRTLRRSMGIELSLAAIAAVEKAVDSRTGMPWVESADAGGALQAGGDAAALIEHACEILEGRALFTGELHAALRERGVRAWAPLDLLLHGPVQEGRIERLPGVRWVRGEWECSRCGSRRIGMHPCVRCGLSRCPQCDECRSLGVSSACMALYHRSPSGAAAPRDVRLVLPFELSPKQVEVSEALERLDVNAFIWAACGAGKTEVTLSAIVQTLRAGGRVLFAVPRRDVADQLARRLQQALHGAEAVLLSGETPQKYAAAPLIVATVQQALRFRSAFRLIVVDEIDAYPLNTEEWLLRGLLRAAHPQGRVIAMSATPPEGVKRRFGEGLPCFILPARPHGFPLPVPEVWIDPLLDGVEREEVRPGAPWLARLVEHVRRTCGAGRRLLVFVPHVRMSAVLPPVMASLGGWRLWSAGGGRDPFTRRGGPVVAGVHAQDPERRAKVRAMEAGRIDVLVSTSLLERGVTLPRLDVLVFAAHCERVYDSAALVQMAGRAGRKREDPTGRVVFWGARETPAVREAVESIAALNRKAQEEGLLVPRVGDGVSCHR